jgi:hypothetical protein
VEEKEEMFDCVEYLDDREPGLKAIIACGGVD